MSTRMITTALAVERAGRVVPALLWMPPAPCALVLVGHGGSGHKQAPAMRALADALARHDMAMLSVDGPVHGDRGQGPPDDAEAAKTRFRAAWRAGIGRTDMARDCAAALDVAQADARLAALPVGYAGVSMGTAYGLPLLATDRRFSAAVLGLWGLDYPASAHLARYAARVRCRVWFTQQLDDAMFSHAGVLALFQAIGASDKRLVAYPGPHRELEGTRLTDAVGFLVASL